MKFLRGGGAGTADSEGAHSNLNFPLLYKVTAKLESPG